MNNDKHQIYKRYLSVFLFVLFLFSCNEDFLDKEPLGQLSSESFFATTEHAIQATNATYNQLRNFGVHVFGFIGMTDIASDNADKGSTPGDNNDQIELDNLTFGPGNGLIRGVWEGFFRGVYRANLAINNIPPINMDEALKARLVGENKFLRAYYYFFLVRAFGHIPLITEALEPSEYLQNQVPAPEVYDVIIQDLTDAIAVLPEKSEYAPEDLGRATKGAARGLLAKVYLFLGDYANAEKYALEVINSGEYALYPDYEEIFRREGENSSESIFEVQAVALEAGGGGSQYNEVQGVRGTPNLGWGFNRPSDALVAEYENGDPRLEATVLFVGEELPDGSAVVEDNPNIEGERYSQKAWQPEYPGGNNNGPGNIRRLRYADVLLIAAEAANELGKPGDALMYLNMVRERARGGDASILPDVTTTDQAELRQAIWHERRVELAMEQHRYFDIVRQGRAAELLQAQGKNFVEGKHEDFPIPQTEIDLSGGRLVQNNGY